MCSSIASSIEVAAAAVAAVDWSKSWMARGWRLTHHRGRKTDCTLYVCAYSRQGAMPVGRSPYHRTIGDQLPSCVLSGVIHRHVSVHHCMLFKNSYLYNFLFSICSSYFLFYNFYFFDFPAPFSKKKKKAFLLFLFFIFGSVLWRLERKCSSSFFTGRIQITIMAKITIIIINYGKSFTIPIFRW